MRPTRNSFWCGLDSKADQQGVTYIEPIASWPRKDLLVTACDAASSRYPGPAALVGDRPGAPERRLSSRPARDGSGAEARRREAAVALRGVGSSPGGGGRGGGGDAERRASGGGGIPRGGVVGVGRFGAGTGGGRSLTVPRRCRCW